MKSKSIIKLFISIFVFVFAIITISGCSNKKKTTTKTITTKKYDNIAREYSTVISTNNIESIEFSLNYYQSYNAKGEYDKKYYVTLSSEYKTNFINSINRSEYKFKYAGFDPKDGDGYKNLPYNTFIINYSDGTKTILDKQYVSKYDAEGNRTYYEALTPYECEIDACMFMEIPKTKDGLSLSWFACDNAFYDIRREEITDSTLGEGETYYRYYKLVEGFISSDYWDIKYKGDEVISATKSQSYINCLDILPITNAGYEYDESDTTIKSVEKMRVYSTIDKKVVPIEVNYINRETGGVPSQEIVCINLNTGENVNYPDFII